MNMLLPVVLRAGFVCSINPISVCFALNPSSNVFVQEKQIAAAERGTVLSLNCKAAAAGAGSIDRGRVIPHTESGVF